MKKILSLITMLNKEAALAGIGRFAMYCRTLHFCLKTGLGPRYFVVAGMARKGFPVQEQWQHISARDYYAALKILNPPAYRKLTQNKLSEKALYQLLQIPTAEFYGYFHPYRGFDHNGASLLDQQQLRALLLSLEGQSVCIKPVEGWGGSGVMAGTLNSRPHDAEPCFQPFYSQQALTASELIQRCQGPAGKAEFVLEACIRQSSQFRAFNPDSVNTLRLWVLEDEPGRAQVIGAYLRVGRAGSAIDNASAGGIMCPVDLARGQVQPGLTKYTPHRDDIHQHPDHAAPLAGVTLESWQEIKNFACLVLVQLPGTRFAGLDVTMTEQGPLLVETNVAPDKDGAAHANIPSIKLREAAASPYA